MVHITHVKHVEVNETNSKRGGEIRCFGKVNTPCPACTPVGIIQSSVVKLSASVYELSELCNQY